MRHFEDQLTSPPNRRKTIVNRDRRVLPHPTAPNPRARWRCRWAVAILLILAPHYNMTHATPVLRVGVGLSFEGRSYEYPSRV